MIRSQITRKRGEDYQRYRHRCEQIVLEEIVAKGIYYVSWRYRDDTLSEVCKSLAKRKLIRRVRSETSGYDTYKKI